MVVIVVLVSGGDGCNNNDGRTLMLKVVVTRLCSGYSWLV